MDNSARPHQRYEWTAYYDQFQTFSPTTIRDGCHPRIMQHETPSAKAIVLIHGLRDSPYFMEAIGEYFFNQLGYDVYLPLLDGHGLKNPAGMESVSHEKWQANAQFALETASARSSLVSIGGLSTGGLLSFYKAATNPLVTGSLYLFAAALDLGGGPFGVFGEIKERLLRIPWVDKIDLNKPLVSDDPYRYSHVDIDGAQELAELIKESDKILSNYSETHYFPKRVFAAHWEGDPRADIAGIEALQCVSDPQKFTFFRMPEEAKVTHPGFVLDVPIVKNGVTYEIANPQFDEMMTAMAQFEQSSGC